MSALNPKIIAIVGMPGAGKSLVSDFFRKKNIPVLRFGDETDKGLSRLGKPLTEANERWYREKLRKDLGMEAMAIKIEPRIREIADTNPIIVLDGLYSWEEYLYLKKKFPQLYIVAVFAPPILRYKRLENRSVRPLTRDESVSRDKAEIENLHKAGPIAMADIVLVNDTTKEDLFATCEILLREFAT